MNAPTVAKAVTTTLAGVLNDDVPAIAVSFADGSTREDVDRATADGLDVAELRIDRYDSYDLDHVVETVRGFEQFPTIATIRTKDEGGDWTGSDADRLELFRAVLPYVHGVDVELSSVGILSTVIEEAHSQGKVVVLSSHNFDATPATADLVRTATDSKRLGADYVKLAAFVRSPEDLRTLASFTLEHAHLGLIVIGMGGHGSASRVFFPALGSKLTYAHIGRWVVSGQLDYRQTFEALRSFYPEFDQRKIEELGLL